jgi:hypothetical protein
MNLLPIGLMALAALGVWLLRGGRATALLVLSVAALYALQPAGTLNVALPTATLLLVVGVWWLLNPAPGPEDGRTLLLIGFTAALFPTVFRASPA